MKCDFKKTLRSGRVTLGTWVTIGHPDVPDQLQGLGFDWLVFDTEHAPIGRETLARLIQAVNGERVCPIVRVGAIDQYMIKSALDMGAHGVVCPLVNSREEAEAAVRFLKYPPVGVRGVAPRKASDYGLTAADYIRTANEMTVLVAQVETREAVENVDVMLSVKDVDIAFVGPSDLTMSLGLLDDRSNPKVVEAMKKVIASCESHGKVPGTLAATPEEAKRAVSLGFRFIGLGSDTRFISGGAKPFIEATK
ncbi:MAG: 4-hydroxy-2-oxo-heptane-1,7-dioate aldolase [Nitrososphaerota archaeon]|nr:4-hydroxy-2-oxo-heptane-1,7-dioate aldolase [Nitrososphaerota archaeon]